MLTGKGDSYQGVFTQETDGTTVTVRPFHHFRVTEFAAGRRMRRWAVAYHRGKVWSEQKSVRKPVSFYVVPNYVDELYVVAFYDPKIPRDWGDKQRYPLEDWLEDPAKHWTRLRSAALLEPTLTAVRFVMDARTGQ